MTDLVCCTVTDGENAVLLYLPGHRWLSELAKLHAVLKPSVDIYVNLDEARFWCVLRRSAFGPGGRRRAAPLRVVQRASP